MVLDPLTLFIVILLNSFTMAIIWGLIWWSYRGFKAARIWTFASLTTALGGLILSLEPIAKVPTNVIGNGVIVFGFCLYWGGVRQFYDEQRPWIASVVITTAVMVVLVVFSTSDPSNAARNAVYAIGQSVPLAFAIFDLSRAGRRTPGSVLAAAAMAIAILGHGVETSANFVFSTGGMIQHHYDIIETVVILIVIFSGVVWNFGMIVMAIDHLRAELAVLTHHDALTGVGNRRLLEERLAAAENRLQRTRRPFALLMVDLDNFKTINDERGHAAGDACLRHVADIVSGMLGPGDLIARPGGDEFCILLSDTDATAAATIAAALVATFREQPVAWGDGAIPLTLSVGVAESSAADPRTGLELMELADQALYVAKRDGRDGYALVEPIGLQPAI